MDNKPHLWISQPTFDDVVESLRAHFDVRAEDVERPLAVDELKARLAWADAAIVGLKERIGADEVAGAGRLRIVANLAVGYDNLDVAALTRAGIAATNTANVLNESVADFAWALMLAAARRMGEAERWLRAGQWTQPAGYLEWMGVDLYRRTLGILGMGRIGQAVARRARGFGMPVIYHNRSRLDAATEQACHARYVDKDTLLAEADALVLVVPRTPETYHIIGAAELARMKPEAVLVNVARGGVVDEAALADALAARRLAAAGLDVFEGEPAVHPRLLELENVVLTPHMASASTGTRRAMAATAVDNVMAMFGQGEHAGRPPNLLNPEVLSRRP